MEGWGGGGGGAGVGGVVEGGICQLWVFLNRGDHFFLETTVSEPVPNSSM